jgi:hypothetical protein
MHSNTIPPQQQHRIRKATAIAVLSQEASVAEIGNTEIALSR